MNVFEAVRNEGVTARQAAEVCGFKPNRNGMIVCPFHDDKNPSMKVDRRYYCFGCGETGDAIDFVANVCNMSKKEAAEKIVSDFGISYGKGNPCQSRPAEQRATVRKRLQEIKFKQDCSHCYRVVTDYIHLLEQWKEAYAPKPDDTEWHPLFVEALKNLEQARYHAEILLNGTMEEQAAFIKDYEKKVGEIESKIKRYAPREIKSVCQSYGCVR